MSKDGTDWSELDLLSIVYMPEIDMTHKERRETGTSYTSVENIHKVIDPLFLSDLNKKLQDIKQIKEKEKRNKSLVEFRENLGTLNFLDPACGSGNFLIETYLSLRRLENEALDAITES